MSTIAQRLTAAIRHHEAGRLAEAESLYRGILQEGPRHAHALHLLGALACQAGRHPEAIALISQALAVQGPHPALHSNLARAYLGANDLAAAEAQARLALQLRPGFADAFINLGVALRRQGRLAEAEAALREACRLAPASVDARCNLGAVLQEEGKFDEARAQLEEAVRLAPGHAQARNNLGAAFSAREEFERAAEHLREAVRLQPSFYEARCNLGVALRHLHRTEESMECFREALRINPDYSPARNNLGYGLMTLGQMPEAVAEFREALRRAPSDSTALSRLGQLAAEGYCRLSDAEMQALEALGSRTDLPPDDRCRVHFALGDLFDKAGDADAAFEQYRRGNELRQESDRRQGLRFDLPACQRMVDRLRAVFTPGYFASVRDFGVDSELPVFIVGMMRSGTTLVEQIIASHPHVFGAGELPDVNRLAAGLPGRLGTPAEYPECAARLSAPAARAMAEEYLARLRQLGGGAARVCDKQPFNYQHLGLIATLFPRARIVHCRRDPIDTCLSAYFQDFSSPHPYAQDLRQLGQYYREYERLMAHWAAVLPVEVFEVRYEELTAEQEAVSRRLIAYCGLEWDERCLRFGESRRVVRTASVLQVRQPMYRNSVAKWKRYERHLGPLIEGLGGG